MFYCELLSGIWIGDTDILVNKSFIEDNNISVILNCTQLYDFPEKEGIQKIRLPFSPVRESNSDIFLLRENKDKIMKFIRDNCDHKNILICCYDGKTLSAFIVALFIATYSKIDKSSIYDILLTKCVDLNLWCDISLFF
tara:strand:+ start:1716 stop:2132 length:417 start_codon:yes stop_codon:yes gene_type:complete